MAAIGENGRSVGEERGLLDGQLVGHRFADRQARDDIPESHGAVPTRSQRELAIGAERHGRHRAAVHQRISARLPSLRAPELSGHV